MPLLAFLSMKNYPNAFYCIIWVRIDYCRSGIEVGKAKAWFQEWLLTKLLQAILYLTYANGYFHLSILKIYPEFACSILKNVFRKRIHIFRVKIIQGLLCAALFWYYQFFGLFFWPVVLSKIDLA